MTSGFYSNDLFLVVGILSEIIMFIFSYQGPTKVRLVGQKNVFLSLRQKFLTFLEGSMHFVEILGRTGFLSFFNGVADSEIEFVLVLVAFLLEAMWQVKLELFNLFEMGIGSVPRGNA